MAERKITSFKEYLKSEDFKRDLKILLEKTPDPEAPVKKILIIVGLLLTPLIIIGALIGYARAYDRFLKDKDVPPVLYPNPPIIYVAMIAGGLVVPALLLAFYLLGLFATSLDLYWWIHNGGVIVLYLIINFLLSIVTLWFFGGWKNGILNYLSEKTRFGSARFAFDEELQEYYPAQDKYGFYISGGMMYDKQGHMLTVAGTRGGKGVNLILPNLLGMGNFKGSWVVIDPKGENAAVSARRQREMGKKVVCLNPWDMLGLASDYYNPLDLLDANDKNVIDDVQLIAETIVPTTSQGDTDHFNSKARSIISALTLHLVTSPDGEEKSLETIWQWLRLPSQEWLDLLAKMAQNTHPNGGEVVEAAANETLSLMQNGSREYASVISTAQRWTDFLKSPALRSSLKKSSFTIDDLVSGNTTLYVIIPADRLKTHYQWLRLVISALMRGVIRKPKERVCFLLDEFYALGYLSEIDVALGAYAGYGVSIWAILQNLVQLRDIYGNNWENFISSCGVRHFFNVNDNTTLDYLSSLFGNKSIPSYDNMGKVSGATARPLITPDELRRASADNIFTLIDQKPVTMCKKIPYYSFLREGQDFDLNPYHKK
jgi:type IV secretion system protein VirD4